MKVREAQLEELDTLKRFEQGIIQYERQFDSNLRPDPIQYYDLANLIQREDALVLVAIIDGEIVASGYALIKQDKPYKQPEYFAYLGFMYVLPKFRGKGINGKILEGLINWAEKKGLKQVQLEVYAENINAIQAYRKKGFEPNLLTMNLNIDH